MLITTCSQVWGESNYIQIAYLWFLVAIFCQHSVILYTSLLVLIVTNLVVFLSTRWMLLQTQYGKHPFHSTFSPV